MAITNYANGAIQTAIAAITIPVPAGYQDGDLFLLIFNSANQAITTPAGWTQITNSPQSTGTAATIGGNRLGIYYKWVSGAQSSVVTVDTGDYNAGIIAGFRGVDPTIPFNVIVGGVKATASTAIVCPSVTTTVADAMIVNVVGLDRDTASTNTSGTFVNANLTSLTRGVDYTTNVGLGGGIAFWTGFKAAVGATGTTTATASGTQTCTYLTIALNPFISIPVTLTIPWTQAYDIIIKHPVVSTVISAVIQTTAPTVTIGTVGPMVVIQASQAVVMTLDSTTILRIQGELVEGSEVALNKDQSFIVNELIEGIGLNLNPSGVLTVFNLKEGEV